MFRYIPIRFLWIFSLLLFGKTALAQDEFVDLAIESQVTNVQPMTGIVFWQGSNTDTDVISLEFSYMLFDQVVKDSGIYNWAVVEDKLNDISSRKHQAIFRFRDTYVGKTTSVPQYIKNMADYHETQGISEGQTTWFPDWTHSEWQRFFIEFYIKFAEKYDNDPRIAFIQVGFGLWAEYHIYDGPFILGTTFPSKEFQTLFLTAMDTLFYETPWSISIDAADGTYSPFEENPNLLNLKFGNFDDSFLCSNHEGYNQTCWNFFSENRYAISPAGGEFNYYTNYDQQHVLDYPNGAHGQSFEEMAAKFKISYMIGNDQPEYQSMERIKQASMASGYKFHILSAKTATDSTILHIKNIGIAPIYYDAWPAIKGVKAKESLKNLKAGEYMECHIPAGGANGVVSIECDRLVPGQEIEFYGTNYSSIFKKKETLDTFEIYPTLIDRNTHTQFYLTTSNSEDLVFKIYDPLGQLKYQQNKQNSLTNTITFPVPGIYLIQVFQSGKLLGTTKIIVQ